MGWIALHLFRICSADVILCHIHVLGCYICNEVTNGVLGSEAPLNGCSGWQTKPELKCTCTKLQQTFES